MSSTSMYMQNLGQNPFLHSQDIEWKWKCYGRTDRWTDNLKTVYPPPPILRMWGYNYPSINIRYPGLSLFVLLIHFSWLSLTSTPLIQPNFTAPCFSLFSFSGEDGSEESDNSGSLWRSLSMSSWNYIKHVCVNGEEGSEESDNSGSLWRSLVDVVLKLQQTCMCIWRGGLGGEWQQWFSVA